MASLDPKNDHDQYDPCEGVCPHGQWQVVEETPEERLERERQRRENMNKVAAQIHVLSEDLRHQDVCSYEIHLKLDFLAMALLIVGNTGMDAFTLTRGEYVLE